MPVTLRGSCRCEAVHFTCDSHTPHPYQRCYCSICRKTAGGGGYAINLLGVAASLVIQDPQGALSVYRAEIDEDGTCTISSAERQFCSRCGTALWLFDPTWPDLVHPLASAIDGDLPMPPSSVHLMMDFKPSWVAPQIGPDDQVFGRYPAQSIEDWHRSRDLWVE